METTSMPFSEDKEYLCRLQTASSVITRLYQISITFLQSRRETDEFCQRHRLHRVQLYLNEKALEIARSTLDNETAYVISDLFMLQFVLFSLRGVPVILGPYCPEHLTPEAAAAVIRQYQLTDLDADQLRVYCSSYPSVTERSAINIFSTLISTVDSKEPYKQIRRIVSHMGIEQDEAIPLEMRLNHNSLIERRYTAERGMINAIIQGDPRTALAQLHIVEKDVAYLKNEGRSIEKEKEGAVILRTTVRLAAIQAGLPALVIDRLTTRSAAELMSAQNEQSVLLVKERLIRSICAAVQENRDKKYSALVQNTLYYLRNEYKNEINIDRLSAEFGVSANHLINTFKKETGVTPNVYLGQQRMRIAAELLRKGQMAVGDISAAVGINDPNYFVKLFKKEFGETPSAFRKRHVI